MKSFEFDLANATLNPLHVPKTPAGKASEAMASSAYEVAVVAVVADLAEVVGGGAGAAEVGVGGSSHFNTTSKVTRSRLRFLITFHIHDPNAR